MELLDDANTELMMLGGDGNVLLLGGESYFVTSEEDAIEFCEEQTESIQNTLQSLKETETTIINEQNELKSILYKRFGQSINLEE